MEGCERGFKPHFTIMNWKEREKPPAELPGKNKNQIMLRSRKRRSEKENKRERTRRERRRKRVKERKGWCSMEETKRDRLYKIGRRTRPIKGARSVREKERREKERRKCSKNRQRSRHLRASGRRTTTRPPDPRPPSHPLSLSHPARPTTRPLALVGRCGFFAFLGAGR